LIIGVIRFSIVEVAAKGHKKILVLHDAAAPALEFIIVPTNLLAKSKFKRIAISLPKAIINSW